MLIENLGIFWVELEIVIKILPKKSDFLISSQSDCPYKKCSIIFVTCYMWELYHYLNERFYISNWKKCSVKKEIYSDHSLSPRPSAYKLIDFMDGSRLMENIRILKVMVKVPVSLVIIFIIIQACQLVWTCCIAKHWKIR